jgi:hypothetical protein
VALATGTRIGTYEVVALIGAGGMAPVTQINVVLNWAEELKRRVPASQ